MTRHLVYDYQGKYAEAERLHKRALAIKEQAFGENHPDLADSLNNLAGVYNAQSKYAEAEGLYQRALAIYEAKLSKDHPSVARILNNLGNLHGAAGNSKKALLYSRKATAAVIAHAAAEAPGGQQKEKISGLVEQRADYFRSHLANLGLAARGSIEPEPALGREALEIAQWATYSSAAAALQQMSSRFASQSGALAILVREQQDLSAAWREKDKALVAALSKSDVQQDGAAVRALRKDIADIESTFVAVNSRLQKGVSRICSTGESEAAPCRGSAAIAWRRRGAGVLACGRARRATSSH